MASCQDQIDGNKEGFLKNRKSLLQSVYNITNVYGVAPFPHQRIKGLVPILYYPYFVLLLGFDTMLKKYLLKSLNFIG